MLCVLVSNLPKTLWWTFLVPFKSNIFTINCGYFFILLLRLQTKRWVKRGKNPPSVLLRPRSPQLRMTASAPEKLAHLSEKASSRSEEAKRQPAALTWVRAKRFHAWREAKTSLAARQVWWTFFTEHAQTFYFAKPHPRTTLCGSKTIICSPHKPIPHLIMTVCFHGAVCPSSCLCSFFFLISVIHRSNPPIISIIISASCLVFSLLDMLCALCNTWRPQQECECPYARYSMDHQSLLGCSSRTQRKLLTKSFHLIHPSVLYYHSSSWPVFLWMVFLRALTFTTSLAAQISALDTVHVRICLFACLSVHFCIQNLFRAFILYVVTLKIFKLPLRFFRVVVWHQFVWCMNVRELNPSSAMTSHSARVLESSCVFS